MDKDMCGMCIYIDIYIYKYVYTYTFYPYLFAERT